MAANYAKLRGPACILGLVLLAGCTSTQTTASISKPATKAPTQITAPKKQVYSYTAADRECLKRAMYFESQRSSRDGMMAVGSVVMNRLTSGAYADTICGVVSQKRQFAPGVMTRKVSEQAVADLNEAADAILVRGERNHNVKEAMFFHTDGLRFPYDNMRYVTVAGGNKFYEKRDEDGELQTAAPKSPKEYMMAYAPHMASQPGLMAVNDISTTTVMAQAAAYEPQPIVQQQPAAPQQVALLAPVSQASASQASVSQASVSQAPASQPTAVAAQAPVPQHRPAEATFPPMPKPVTVAMDAAGPAPQAYAASAPQAQDVLVPLTVPVPRQKPQVAGIIQASQPMGSPPQIWTMRNARP